MKRAGPVSYINTAMHVFQQVMLLFMFILGVGGLDPSACKSLPVNLNSSQKFGVFLVLFFLIIVMVMNKKENSAPAIK